MHIKKQKSPRHLKHLLISTSLIALTACSTTKHRDERLIENLEKQNAVIDAATADRQSDEIKAELEKNEVLKAAEVRLVNALTAVKVSNEIVMSKMKPETKKECADGKDEGADDEQ